MDQIIRQHRDAIGVAEVTLSDIRQSVPIRNELIVEAVRLDNYIPAEFRRLDLAHIAKHAHPYDKYDMNLRAAVATRVVDGQLAVDISKKQEALQLRYAEMARAQRQILELRELVDIADDNASHGVTLAKLQAIWLGQREEYIKALRPIELAVTDTMYSKFRVAEDAAGLPSRLDDRTTIDEDDNVSKMRMDRRKEPVPGYLNVWSERWWYIFNGSMERLTGVARYVPTRLDFMDDANTQVRVGKAYAKTADVLTDISARAPGVLRRSFVHMFQHVDVASRIAGEYIVRGGYKIMERVAPARILVRGADVAGQAKNAASEVAARGSQAAVYIKSKMRAAPSNAPGELADGDRTAIMDENRDTVPVYVRQLETSTAARRVYANPEPREVVDVLAPMNQYDGFIYHDDSFASIPDDESVVDAQSYGDGWYHASGDSDSGTTYLVEHDDETGLSVVTEQRGQQGRGGEDEPSDAEKLSPVIDLVENPNHLGRRAYAKQQIAFTQQFKREAPFELFSGVDTFLKNVE